MKLNDIGANWDGTSISMEKEIDICQCDCNTELKCRAGDYSVECYGCGTELFVRVKEKE